MGNAWFITEHLVEDHRVALESAADRQRLIRSTRPVDDRPRHLGGYRHPRLGARGHLQHRAV